MIFSLASEALKEGTAPRPKNHKAFFLNDQLVWCDKQIVLHRRIMSTDYIASLHSHII
jgi:hypothetical protein